MRQHEAIFLEEPGSPYFSADAVRGTGATGALLAHYQTVVNGAFEDAVDSVPRLFHDSANAAAGNLDTLTGNAPRP